MTDAMRCTGKTIIVSRSSGGIGEGIARHPGAGFVNGVNLPVDGGTNAGHGQPTMASAM